MTSAKSNANTTGIKITRKQFWQMLLAAPLAALGIKSTPKHKLTATYSVDFEPILNLKAAHGIESGIESGLVKNIQAEIDRAIIRDLYGK